MIHISNYSYSAISLSYNSHYHIIIYKSIIFKEKTFHSFIQIPDSLVRFHHSKIGQFSPVFKWKHKATNVWKQLHQASGHTYYSNSRHVQCYETIMFSRVTHTLKAAVRLVCSLYTSFTFCNITIRVVLWYPKRIYAVPLPVFHW